MSKLHVGHTDKSINEVIPHNEQETIPSKAPGRKKTGHCKRRSKRSKPGRPRKPRSMGRYPFLTWMNKYIEEYRPYKAKSTMDQEERVLKRIHRQFQQLKKQGLIESVNPEKLTDRDLGKYIEFLKEKGLDVNTQAKQFCYLKNLLDYVGNNVIDKMNKQKKIPKEMHDKPIESLSEKQVQQILKASQTFDGWEGEIIAFMIPAFRYLGVRTKELVKEEFDDVDIENWMFIVSHPKGEDSWGKKRPIGIPGPLRPHLIRFLKGREERLKLYPHIETTALIPNLSRNNATGEPYKNQSFTRWKREVEKQTGISFDFRMLRRTYGQHLRDRDVPIDAVSKLMGHKTTQTTEKYYARIRDEHAFQLAEEAWSRSPNW